MISPKEADVLATSKIEEYINACNCQTDTDVANALMKLASMAGIAMCGVVGQQEAVARMQGTVEHVASPECSGGWQQQRVQ